MSAHFLTNEQCCVLLTYDVFFSTPIRVSVRSSNTFYRKNRYVNLSLSTTWTLGCNISTGKMYCIIGMRGSKLQITKFRPTGFNITLKIALYTKDFMLSEWYKIWRIKVCEEKVGFDLALSAGSIKKASALTAPPFRVHVHTKENISSASKVAIISNYRQISMFDVENGLTCVGERQVIVRFSRYSSLGGDENLFR